MAWGYETNKVENVQKKKSVAGNSSKSTIKCMARNKRKGYRVRTFEIKPKGMKLKYEYMEIVISTGGKRKIQVGFDDEMKVAYINGKVYTKEAVEYVTKLLR